MVSHWTSFQLEREQIYESSVKVTTKIGQCIKSHSEPGNKHYLNDFKYKGEGETTKKTVATFPALQGKENIREMRINSTVFFTSIKKWNAN